MDFVHSGRRLGFRVPIRRSPWRHPLRRPAQSRAISGTLGGVSLGPFLLEVDPGGRGHRDAARSPEGGGSLEDLPIFSCDPRNTGLLAKRRGCGTESRPNPRPWRRFGADLRATRPPDSGPLTGESP